MFTIEIRTDNAAFAEDPAGELARILRTVADRVEAAQAPADGVCRDLNGNAVGGWCWSEDESCNA